MPSKACLDNPEIGIYYLREGVYDAACAAAERSLAADRRCAPAFVILAACYLALGAYSAAEDYLNCALLAAKDETTKLRACEVRARLLYHRDRDPRAKAAIEQFLANPEYVPIDLFALLYTLRKVRDKAEGAPAQPWTLPPYCDRPLNGRTICVWQSRDMQGLGDFVQDVRFVQFLVAMGARVVMEVEPRLQPLLQAVPGVTLARGDERAYRVTLPTLTTMFGPFPPDGVCVRSLSAVDFCWPGAPYLKVPASKAEAWRARVLQQAPDGLRVGLCWHSSTPTRQMPFAAVREHLLDVPGVRWFNLQGGTHRADAAGTDIINIEDEHGTMLDLAAIIENLDLVISADTMVPHLAGALGKPVLLVLNQHPAVGGYDARWLEDRADTALYPSMRLFRQQTKDNWSVLRAVRDQLEARVQLSPFRAQQTA